MEIIRAERNVAVIEAIYYILEACGKDMYEKNGLIHWLNPYPKENIEADIKNKSVFVVMEDEKYIATFTLACDDDDFYLSKFAVLPEFSGKGIGKKCLEFAESFVLKNSANVLKLDVYDQSRHAIDFYLKNGFVITGEKPTRRFNVLLMEKNLK